MDATTTHSTSWLIKKLSAAYPTISFQSSDHFAWSPSSRTVLYDLSDKNAPFLLLHELAHALLGHRTYTRDIELVAMESAAWETAAHLLATDPELLPGALLRPTDAIVQDHLDTYRDWLHARSTCPKCSATGYQTASRRYACPACAHQWRVNEARVCALRRYTA